jgi:ketosteroid isomerase-like protein
VGPTIARAQSPEDDVRAVIDAYHAALASGDSTAALSLLAADVTILESGNVEDKDHYRSGHLAGDMRFAQAVPRERSEITVRLVGDVAWAWSTSVTQGRMGEREINSRGAELMVLARREDAWRIVAIHWSSRSAR